MTKDWIHWVGHSPVCQILLQIVVRAVITFSSPAWTSSAGMFLLLTSLTSMIVLQPPLLCEGWGGHPLCLSGYSSVLMDLHWPCSCTAQSRILFISSVSVALHTHTHTHTHTDARVKILRCLEMPAKHRPSWKNVLEGHPFDHDKIASA